MARTAAEMLHVLAQKRADFIRLREVHMKELALTAPVAAQAPVERAPLEFYTGDDDSENAASAKAGDAGAGVEASANDNVKATTQQQAASDTIDNAKAKIQITPDQRLGEFWRHDCGGQRSTWARSL